MKKISSRQLNKLVYAVVVLVAVWLFQNFEIDQEQLAQSKEVKTPAPITTNQVENGQIIVSRVIDGDTVAIEMDGKEQKIRLIGVNTPETVDPRRSVQCFGQEASAFAKKLLTGQVVRLESDISQDEVDKYGRWLRYVYLSDGRLVNQELIALGYGSEYTYKTPYKYQAEFKAAEANAKKEKLGLWSPGVCQVK